MRPPGWMAALALVALAPAGAVADEPPRPLLQAFDPLPDQPTDYHSPQHFAFEIKFGPYSPDIDSSPGLKGHPFSDLFVSQLNSDGSPNPDIGKRPAGKLLTTLELDWQIWHGFGSLGVAGSVGIMRRTTHSFRYPSSGIGQPCQVPNCERSSDTTALGVMPFALEAVYRFDVLALRYHIPLVPYLKGGIAYYLFWMENGGGGISHALNKKDLTKENPNDPGIGGTFGLVAHPGVALLLDILDPGTARTLDSELGINHTYLFFEMHYAWINGFNSGSKLVLSDLTWNLGVAFEF